jgi:hypothetical protein
METKRPGSVTVLLAGLLVLLAAAGFFAPILHCRWCWRDYQSMADWAEATVNAHPEMRDEVERNVRAVRCWRCGDRHRLSVYRLLFDARLSRQ